MKKTCFSTRGYEDPLSYHYRYVCLFLCVIFVFVFVFVLVLLHESELCTKVCGCYKESVSCCRLSETQGGPPWIVVFQKLNGNFVGRWIWRRLSIKSQVEPILETRHPSSHLKISLAVSLSVPNWSSDLGLWAVVNAIGDLQRFSLKSAMTYSEAHLA